VTERDVQGALEKHRVWVIFDNTNRRFVLCAECKQLWPCEVSILAAEVTRLRRLHEARPPYVMSQWEPAELAELLARDAAILQAREDVT
jgi:hypothetical protein